MTVWAIAYTKDSRGRDRLEPYIFPDTVRLRRKEAWAAFQEDFSPELTRKLRKEFGAKAIKVRLEVVA